MKQKLIIVFLIVMSVGLTVFQLVESGQKGVDVVCVMRDVKEGQVIEKEDVGILKSLDSLPKGALKNPDKLIGKVAVVSLSKGTVAMESYFEEVVEEDLQKGESKTAIRLTPDTAICFTSEIDSSVQVYFVGDKGELQKLGDVVLKQFYDQQMEQNDLLMYVVVEGKKSVIDKIVQKRALGRLELVKSN